MQPSAKAIALSYGAASEKGARHAVNEDFLVLEPLAGIFAVADGIGGYEGGAEASEFVSSVFLGELLETETRDLDTKMAKLAFLRAKRKALIGLSCLAKTFPAFADMGTTLTLGWVVDHVLHIAHIGDSRLYLLRNKRLTRLTKDHSLVEEMCDAEVISRSEVHTNPLRNIVTRSISCGVEKTLDIHSHRLRVGDRLLLATDGITDVLPDEILERAASAAKTPFEFCEWLIQAACLEGATDDMTAVAFDVEPGA